MIRFSSRRNRPIERTRLTLLCAALLMIAAGGVVFDVGGARGVMSSAAYADEPANESVARTAEPDDPYEPFVVIRAKKVITNAADEDADQEIDNGMVVIANGKIHSVGRSLEYPLNAKVIDATDDVVMPGLISPVTRIGLPRYSRGGVHGDLCVVDELYPDPERFEPLLDAGFTTVGYVPDGDGFPGRAHIMRTAGPEDQQTLLSPAYLYFTGDKSDLREALKRAKQEIEKVEKARAEHEKKLAELAKKAEQAKQEAEEKKPEEGDKDGAEKKDEKPTTQSTTQPTSQPAFEPPKIDPALQPLVDLLQEKDAPGLKILIQTESAADYVHFAEVLAEYDVAHRFVLDNDWQSDFEYVLERFAEDEPPVLMQPVVSRVPYSAERINLPRMFADAGCELSLRPWRDSTRAHHQYRGRVAELVRAGLPRETALKAMTLLPARLLDIDDQIGSIAEGKRADLVILSGDPLDPTTRVRSVMIAGEIVHRVEEPE